MRKCAVNISGKRFGRLVAIEYAGKLGKDSSHFWRCICDCGKEVVVKKASLMKGFTRSCGCLRSDVAREKAIARAGKGAKKENKRLYTIWNSMKARCLNPNRKESKYYLLKGIRICEEWANDFLAFRDWALKNGYDETLTLDRIDNDGDYKPENCRWTTWTSQNNNTSKNKFISIDGETLTVAEWTRKMNFSRGLISSRLKRGWTEERAVKTLPRKTAMKNNRKESDNYG